MTARSVPTSGPITIGILYPTVWFGDADALATEIATVRGIDARIEVVAEMYDEPHELRTMRGRVDGAGAARDLAPQLTDAQRAMFANVNAVIALDLPFDVGDVSPNLGWVQGVGAGSAQLQSAGLAAAGIRLTTSAGSNAVAIAEFVVGRVLQERKRFREMDEQQRLHNWVSDLYGTELAGATVGLIGLGAINAAVAERLAAFGVTVLASRRSAKPGDTAPNIDELYPTDQLHAMFARCDTVISAVPETPETIGLLDAHAFAAMRSGAFFVNVGRGTLLDEAALIDALTSGHLRGAALDVASEEPLPANNPLWDAPNLYLSYHCSSSPAALFINLHRLWRDNIARWIRGDSLRNEVDLLRGY